MGGNIYGKYVNCHFCLQKIKCEVKTEEENCVDSLECKNESNFSPCGTPEVVDPLVCKKESNCPPCGTPEVSLYCNTCDFHNLAD